MPSQRDYPLVERPRRGVPPPFGRGQRGTDRALNTVTLITPLLSLFFLLALVMHFVGCATHSGDRGFDPYQKSRDLALDQRGDHFFAPVALTNRTDPELLKRPTNYFRLGPGDVIEIKILGDELSATKTLVGPDGKIYFNLLRGTFVWGLTLSETTELLEQQLNKELNLPPRLSVILRSVGSRRLWLMGQVQGPGIYDMVVPMTLLEAISAAGGLASTPGSSEITADLKKSFVIRGDKRIEVDFDKLINRGDLSQNIFLQPDDFVLLAPSQMADVYVLGAVLRPGSVGLTDGISLTRAIANAGGIAKYGYGSHVAIVRGSLTEPRIAILDFKDIAKGKAADVYLAPGDLIYVPFVPYKKLAELADSVLNQFVSSIAINEGRNAVQKGSAPVGVSVGVGSVQPVTP